MAKRITPNILASFLFAYTASKENTSPGTWREPNVDRSMELRDGALTEERQSSCDDHSQGLDCGCEGVVPSTTQEKGWFGKAYEKEYVIMVAKTE